MIDYGRVQSTLCPETLVVDEKSVWKHTDITPVTENTGTDMEFVGYEFHMIQYTKEEYILLQAEENAALQNRLNATEEDLTNTQMALTEVYELLTGGETNG